MGIRTRTPKGELLMRVPTSGFTDVTDMPSQSLQRFQQALAKKMRGVQFYVTNVNVAWVYYPHEPFARGSIIARDTPPDPFSLPDNFYWEVESRKIENGRYSSASAEHHRHGSGYLATAVKKAAAALTPWSIYELSTIYSKLYEAGRYQQINEVHEKITDAAHYLGVGLNSPALDTLKALTNEILDVNVRTKVQDLVLYSQQHSDMQLIGASPMFVYVGRTPHGHQVLDTLRLDAISYSYTIGSEESKRYWADDSAPAWPSDEYTELVGRLSVLSMATEGDFISGVGMKVDEDMFYVC